MLEMRNILKKKMNKKGFTLAELLVVVAILAILVAVSIPIFTGKLQEAKENTDLANMRAAKAAAINYYHQLDIPAGRGLILYYDAEKGKAVQDAPPKTGYNQVTQKVEKGVPIGPKGAVVKIIFSNTDTDDYTVTPSWTKKGE